MSITDGKAHGVFAGRLDEPGIMLHTGGLTKRAFDVSLAVLGLIAIAPLLLVVAALIVSTSGRPIVIRHRRIGAGGREFECLKFRTMLRDGDEVLRKHFLMNPDAEHEWRTTRKLKNDPRVTRLGTVLRKTSVDELPQLVNVIAGHMSLIGPRPIVADEISHYGEAFEWYCRARPGLTGAWQISGRSDTGYHQRVQLDREYVLNWTFRSDVVILLRTIPAVLSTRGSY